MAYDMEQTDNASGNDLYFAGTCQVDSADWVKDRVLCLSHQNHHCGMALVHTVVGVPVVSQLYTIASFLRMGTYMLRCVMALRRFLAREEHLQVVSGASSSVSVGVHDVDKACVETATDYLVANYEGTLKTKQQWRKKLDALFSIWNSGYSPGSPCVHRCSGVGCCVNGRETTVQRLAAAVDVAMLSRCPVQPSLGNGPS